MSGFYRRCCGSCRKSTGETPQRAKGLSGPGGCSGRRRGAWTGNRVMTGGRTRYRSLRHAELPSASRGAQTMGMAAPYTRWTADRRAALPDDGRRYEIIDGELLVTPSPGVRHQRAAFALAVRLRGYLVRHPVGEVIIAPADVEFSDDTVVEPDVVVVPLVRGPAGGGPEARGPPPARRGGALPEYRTHRSRTQARTVPGARSSGLLDRQRRGSGNRAVATRRDTSGTRHRPAGVAAGAGCRTVRADAGWILARGVRGAGGGGPGTVAASSD